MAHSNNSNEPWLVDTEVFIHPFTCIISGPTQSGKSTFVEKVLINKSILINPEPEKIYFCYSLWQPIYDKLKSFVSNIVFFKGILNIEELNYKENKLIILDDLLSESEEDSNILKLFHIDSHHKNISVFLITQNLFSQGKFFRSISLNSHYLVIFKNPRDKSQINTLARQMYPSKNSAQFLIDSFEDAVENKKNSYLFIDLKQNTLEKNRVQTGILPGEDRVIYTKR